MDALDPLQLLNVVVSMLLGDPHHHVYPADATTECEVKHPSKSTRDQVDRIAEDITPTPPCCTCCTKDPVSQLNAFHKMASVLQHEKDSSASDNDEMIAMDESSHTPAEDDASVGLPAAASPSPASEEPRDDSAENKRLVKMGMNTALAIALHNFPEGLATFVAALNDPKVGVVLGVAIAIHNIPEGLCVALPIYYATGKRMNAFLWALLSGASEIVAALLGWAILANRLSETTYATMFGLVAGMMVIISIRELLPTAHFYDPEDTVVTNSYIGGMVVIALSLVLFQL